MDGNKNKDTVTAAPKRLLSVPDGVLLVMGMVIGSGIFGLPPLVAGNVGSGAEFVLVWILGGIISLCGALVYAELASRFPVTGGEYVFLTRGLGRGVAFVFAWARMTVIQTGAIAAVSFIFGRYASTVIPLGGSSEVIWAVIGVVALTALNLAGTNPSKRVQNVVQTAVIFSVALVGIVGLALGSPAASTAPSTGGGAGFGLAMMFVLFTYGGWNEAAYLGGEVRDPRRDMIRILIVGLVAVMLLYLLINVGYLSALGLDGIRNSKAVAVDVMRGMAGDSGALIIALFVCIAAFTTMNAAIFTGARTTWALGRDFSLFRRFGAWREEGSTPANALLLQGVITVVLIVVGSFTRDGFEAMVAYTAPVFWTFFLLTGITLFVFRRRSADAPPFRVPLYPVIPLVFCAMCLYMLYRSIDFILNPDFGPHFGTIVLFGIVIMVLGIPLYFLARGGVATQAR